MQSIQEIINTAPITSYKGSQATKNMVEKQIEERFGKEVAMDFDPRKNVRSFGSWTSIGYRVKKGEKSLKSYTIVDSKDEKGVITKIKRPCALFHWLQVEKLIS